MMTFLDPGTDQHPLVAALIKSLPPAGSAWSPVERRAWLSMMGKAFTLAYGAAASDVTAAIRPAPASKAARKSNSKGGRVKSEPAFYIDLNGVARCAGGAPIDPEDIVGSIVDLRGEHGSLASITWANGRKGVGGLQIAITTNESDDSVGSKA